MNYKIQKVIKTDKKWLKKRLFTGWFCAIGLSCLLAFVASKFFTGDRGTMLGLILCMFAWVIIFSKTMILSLMTSASAIFICENGIVIVRIIAKKTVLHIKDLNKINLTRENDNWVLVDDENKRLLIPVKQYPTLDKILL